MAPREIPAAEVDVTVDLVRRLLASQHPDLAGRDLRLAASGWDNVMLRLGDDLAVRLPRRAAGAVLIEHEQRWLPELAPLLPIPVPVPVRVGRPELGFPWAWSVTPWFEGDVAADVPLRDPSREARRLGEFMAALHRPAPPDAPANPLRDVHVGDRTDHVVAAVAQVTDTLDALVPDGAARAMRRWRELTATDRYAGPPSWVAGDVHTGNVIVRDGAITALIDFGDLCAGDPAVDLAVAWMLFRDEHRPVFRDAAGAGQLPVDDAMWARAEAWALVFAVLYVASSSDDERLVGMGSRLFAELLG